jgi:hypothetical protein
LLSTLLLAGSSGCGSADDAPERAAQIPELEIAESDGLALDVEIEPRADARRLTLRAGGGQMVLVLSGASANGSMGFGSAVLEPPVDREAGAKFLAAVTRWLGTEVPPPAEPGGEHRALGLDYAELGEDEGWQAYKLFLAAGKHSAEIYLNLSEDGRHGTLVENDEDYRDDLVAILAAALRDGFPPRRTVANDPLLESDLPLVRTLRPVADARRVVRGSWLSEGYLGERSLRGKRSELLLWTALDQPPRRVATLDGRVTQMQSAPDGRRCAISLVFPEHEEWHSLAAPGLIGIWDPATGRMLELVRTPATPYLYLVWSPDGRWLAAAFSTAGDATEFTHVFDTRTAALVATADGALDAYPIQWTDAGLLLRGDFDDATSRYGYYRWQPTRGAPVAVPASDSAFVLSPAGAHRVSLVDGALQIVAGGGLRTVAFSRSSDRAALELLDPGAEWIRPTGLVLDLDEAVRLDVESGRLRYVFPEPGTEFKSARPDGRVILAKDAHDRWVFGNVE